MMRVGEEEEDDRREEEHGVAQIDHAAHDGVEVARGS